ncbi:unnamed protein product [Brassica oleracea]
MLCFKVFANKQDLPNAMNAAEITDKLGLHSLRQRHWYIQSTCATSGEGFMRDLTGSPTTSQTSTIFETKTQKVLLLTIALEKLLSIKESQTWALEELQVAEKENKKEEKVTEDKEIARIRFQAMVLDKKVQNSAGVSGNRDCTMVIFKQIHIF